MVLLQLEQHAQRWLLGVAPFLIAETGSYILTDKGLKIKLASGYQFNLPVLTGQGACEVSGPCLVAVGVEAVQIGCTLNHDATLGVELRWPADAKLGIGTREELLACFIYAAGQLQTALYRTDLSDLLTESITGDAFTCFRVAQGGRVQTSAWDKRNRIYRIEVKCEVASAYVPKNTPP
jgi:hypothetical protein